MDISGLILGAGAGVTDTMQNVTQNLLNDKTNQQSKDWWLQTFDKQNEYNSPLMQRRRLEAAGFNPNLVYGHGSIANTSTAGVSKDFIPNKAVNIGDSISKAQQIFNSNALLGNDIKRVELEATKNEFQNVNTMAQTAKTWADTAKTMQDKQQASEMFVYSLDAMKQNIEQTKLSNEKQRIENSNLPEKIKLDLKQLSVNINNTIQSTAESKQRVLESKNRMEKTPHEINYLKQQLLTAKSAEDRNRVQDQLTRAQRQTEMQRTESERARVLNIYIDTQLKNGQIDLNQARQIRETMGVVGDVFRSAKPAPKRTTIIRTTNNNNRPTFNVGKKR